MVSAVLDSAAQLFAERGPAATSIRDIAERAGVNHGLVFRHFGAKDSLVAAVLNHLGAETAALDANDPLTANDPRWQRHWQVLARCILDGFDVGSLQDRFPIMERLLDQSRHHHPDDRAAAIAVANVAALELGWRLFGSFLRGATGLADVPDSELRPRIDREAVRMLRGQ
ncbi:TetR family transcriptional regulator [Nocardia tenerifensis]|uniref:TetR family transcriptional regulator n=1 Tax=Nocardia tenerifensis TaxID=228006 RepID=A0A318KBY7_9NOCA|nr:TetR family transcriptional regulator [Nocardia tenerifensis]